jgi:hypothetical protein
MAGFNAARNCLRMPTARLGVLPALRELELRDVGDGTTFAEAAPNSAAAWRKISGAYFFVAAPRLERVRVTWLDEEWDGRGALLRQVGVAQARRREYSAAQVVEYTRTPSTRRAASGRGRSSAPARRRPRPRPHRRLRQRALGERLTVSLPLCCKFRQSRRPAWPQRPNQRHAFRAPARYFNARRTLTAP